jgi:Asp-tRNA(Asn)/Glu-tRNA(Gln) amidotransferase A subunit family amidase
MAEQGFELPEASIAGLHEAIRRGHTTCVQVVQTYIERAQRYNGVSTQLLTRDGKPWDAPTTGPIRAQRPVQFPTQTLRADDLLPDLDQYRGPDIEWGRMETTASDPQVHQQMGWVRGVARSGQLNALATLNIRGERSVTCRGDYDRHPSLGPLPPGAPPACEGFRHLPDALEQAALLDEQWGQNPDLEKMPLYGVVFSFKDAFDTKDMRSTGGGDAAYDIDFPARDHILVDQLRKKGAIIYAKALMTEYNGRAGDPGGQHKPQQVLPTTLGFQRSTWGGTPVNPYDTRRSASLGSSSGSGVSVSANLVMASLGEETRMSTRGPANHNAVALILPHKAMLGFDGGAIGADIYCDRTGILCRTLDDCATVLDALKDPDDGYYDPRDPYTTVPRSSVLPAYRPHLSPHGQAGALQGLRLGVVRESMLTGGSQAAEPITQAAAREIQSVLAEHLGASLVESSSPHWTPDPRCERMAVDFRVALARLVPVFMPDLLFRLKPDGSPVFEDFAAQIERTEFAPGVFHGSGTMAPMDYLVALTDGLIPAPENLDVATVQQQILANGFRYHISQYLSRRANDWAAVGQHESLRDWRSLNERSKFWGDDQRAAFLNWEEVRDPRNPLGGRQGVDERIMLRELLRRVDMMVILENKLDALVRLHTPLPPALIGGAEEPGPIEQFRQELLYGPNAGLTEILVPAGYVQVAYDATFALDASKTRYNSVASRTPTALDAPGLPFSLVFRAEPGKEDLALRVASAYEKASRRRVAPPMFP